MSAAPPPGMPMDDVVSLKPPAPARPQLRGPVASRRRRPCARSSPGRATIPIARASPTPRGGSRRPMKNCFPAIVDNAGDQTCRACSVRCRDTKTWCSSATSPSFRIASITWRHSSARRISAIIRATAWSACRSSRGSSTPSPAACRRRRRCRPQIVVAIDKSLPTRGVAVMIEAEHTCMAMRGVRKQGVSTVTTQFTGVFRDDPNEQTRFFSLLRGGR